MPLDERFFRTAHEHFQPYSGSSGTEHLAPLLYSMVRMARPRTLVEFGTGYSSLFLLRAIADNAHDARLERIALIEKSRRLKLREALAEVDLSAPFDTWPESVRVLLERWAFEEGIACSVAPGFLLTPHEPHLYGFEAQDADSDYTRRVRGAIAELGLESRFTHLCGQECRADALDEAALPIDFALNDCDDYREFFLEFWERLNPGGGIMIFHNVTAYAPHYEDIQWMRQQRAATGDLEVLVLEEPHKFNQNGCAILRRVGGYAPRFALANPAGILRDAATLLASEFADPVPT